MTQLIDSSKKKFALIVGINYYGTSSQLNGCINDCNNIKKFLMDKCGFKESEILMLVDDGSTPQKPTRQNIENGMSTLVQKALMGCKFLWFSYSGHGSYQKDASGDELDGNDELLCPVDYDTNGFIEDDYIYANLVKKLPQDTTLVSLMDCCHSGTILDLPYTYATKLTDANDNKPKATVISISGCRDNQTSADAYISQKSQGAMTWSFLSALLKNNYNIKIQDLIGQMRTLLSNEYTQYPLLGLSNQSLLNSWFLQNNLSLAPNTTITNSIGVSVSVSVSVSVTLTVDNNFRQTKWNILSVSTGKAIYSIYQSFTRSKEKITRNIPLPSGTYKLVINNNTGNSVVTASIIANNKNLLNKNILVNKLTENTFEI